MSGETRAAKVEEAALEAAVRVVLDPQQDGGRLMDRYWAVYRARRILAARSVHEAAAVLDGIDWICGPDHNRMVAASARAAADGVRLAASYFAAAPSLSTEDTR